jgi:hypothetical protein
MSQLLHAGIVAGRRQLAALVVFTLVLLLTAQITENSWPSTTPLLPWGCLLVAFGFALTSGRSIEVTARRIRRGSDLFQVVGPKHVLMALTAQFGLADPACNIGAAGAAQHNNRRRRIFWSRLGRFNHMSGGNECWRGVLWGQRTRGPKSD